MALLISASQSRAGRALLGWSQQDLAKHANVGASTVADFERGRRTPVPNNADAMRAALEAAGVTFYGGGAIIDAPQGTPPKISSGEPIRWVDATDLDHWADRRDGQAAIPELVSRLINATSGFAAKMRFPAGDSVQHSGWDGICEAPHGITILPAGRSAWEIGCQRKSIRTKADEEYEKRTAAPGAIVPKDATFVFVTPRRFPDKDQWAAKRRAEETWLNVRVIDADDLIQWLDLYPSVAYWLATLLGKRPPGIQQLDVIWTEWSLATQLPLTADLLLAARDEDAAQVLRWLRNTPSVLSVQAESPEEALAFLHASISELPPEYRAAYLSRALVPIDDDTARFLGTSASPLIIILRGADAGLAQSLVAKGHHVYLALGADAGTPSSALRLTRARRDLIEEGLREMGLESHLARSLAADSGRSITVIRRLIPAAPGRLPRWAQTAPGPALLGAILAGGWDDNNERDHTAMEKLTGQSYDDIRRTLMPLATTLDGPLRKSGAAWSVASRRDAWFLLAAYLSSADIDNLLTVFAAVFGMVDPTFGMGSKERFLSFNREEPPSYSSLLRESLADTLILLAVFGDRAINVPAQAMVVEQAVGKLLNRADEKLWWSLRGDFPKLAEAAPVAFLTAVEDALADTPDALKNLFIEDDSQFFSGHYGAHLLFALERLAWNKSYLARVTHILADLMAIDPGGKQVNRPASSLTQIFLLWSPQTNATIEERFRVIDRLRAARPAVAWSLLLAMIPRSHNMTFHSSPPQWRDFAGGEQEVVTYELLAKATESVASRLMDDVGNNPRRWQNVIDCMGDLAAEIRTDIRRRLFAALPLIADAQGRAGLRASIRHLLWRHRTYSEMAWALPETELSELQTIYDQLEPNDAVDRVAWFFEPGSALPNPPSSDWHDLEDETRRLRLEAVRSILAEGGVPMLRSLIQRAERSSAISEAIVAANLADEVLDEILEAGLLSDRHGEADVAHALIAIGSYSHGTDWSEALLQKAVDHQWGTRTISRILRALPAIRSTWDAAAEAGEAIELEYWKNFNSRPFKPSPDDLSFACDRLLKVQRARFAVQVLGGPKQAKLSPDLVVRVLLAAVTECGDRAVTNTNEGTMFGHFATELINWLDTQPQVDRSVIARLEWAYFAILQYSQRPAKTLQKALASDPAFFVQILKMVYGPSDESGIVEPEPEDPTSASAVASQAWRLLHDWERVPGTNEDGTFDSAALNAWVKEVRILCAESGRADIGDQRIGEIISASKCERNGQWPPLAVRDVIEATQSKHLENGVYLGVYNRRGVTVSGVYDGGEKERILATSFRNWSKAFEFDWPRTAALLERIAANYEEHAREEDERAEQRQWR